jgi:outer membrane protein assembly factor BamA
MAATHDRTTKDTKITKDTKDFRLAKRHRPFVLFVLFFVCFVVSTHAQAPERIAEIRIHGNHTTPDADVLALSGLHVGDPATDDRLNDAAAKLRASDRFDGVDVRRRYLSIADLSQILIVIVVDEKPGVSADDLTPGIGRRVRASGMWLPILNYTDGYGLTYGVRTTFQEPLGPGTRVSMPLSWGGERRAGVELEKRFGADAAGADVARTFTVRGGLAEYRRINPYADASDRRLEARVRAERPIASWLRAGGETRVAQVTFGGLDEGRHDAEGADVTIDTRVDPVFPRNAVDATAGIERLGVGGGSAARVHADLRGYVGVVGTTVVALRGQFIGANAALPVSEQSLLGGTDSLRGYAAGHRSGDNLIALSLEVRQPLTSPLSTGLFGVRAFVDEGTTWNHGERRTDHPFERGTGGGVYLGAGPIVATVDLAWPEHGKARGHVGLGVTF